VWLLSDRGYAGSITLALSFGYLARRANVRRVVAGDFFAAAPADGDLHVFRGVLHDWDGDAVRRILANCRRALAPGGRVLVSEHVLDPDNRTRAEARFMDLHLLVIYGPAECTAADFRALHASAAFRLTRIIPPQGSWSLIEAVPD
jgi:SAM-dependent methyltransferase